MRFFALVLLGLITSFAALAQGSFLLEQREINRQSSKQWMVQELVRLHPSLIQSSFFDAPTTPFDLAFGDDKSEAQASVIKLASLCHLYFPLIEKKLLLANLPLEYRFLPLALSGMNTSYYGPNDRSGMWSMDFLTARKWHLRIDSLVDERKGGDFTIDVAIKELKQRHQNFQGDISKVAQSYYLGLGLSRLLESDSSMVEKDLLKQSHDFVSYFHFLNNYFPKIISSTSNSLNFYFDIFSGFNPFVPKDTISFEALIAQLPFDLTKQLQMNPVFIGDYLDPSYQKVRYMLEFSAFDKAMSLGDSLYRWKPAKVQKKEDVVISEEKKFHKVKKGETLGSIAKKYRVSLKDLKKWNKLKSDKIRLGQKLIVYQKTVKRKPKPELDSSIPIFDPTAVPDAIDSLQLRPPVVVKTPIKKSDSKDKSIKHKVKSGESLWIIAKKYKVTPEQIMKWNKCGEKIRPGQVLKIYPK